MIFDEKNLTIETNRLLLRKFKLTDADKVTDVCNNYNIFINTLSLPYPYTKDSAITWIECHEENFENDKFYEFAICDKLTGELYGSMALSNNKKYKNGELAYMIGEPYWNKGFGTEAAQAMIRWAFDHKSYHKVYARYFVSNPASGRIMEKVGMKKEGLLKDQVIKEGQFMDLVYYGMINPKY
jgi:RimJ/RimL family protein N-acetyltransferase